MRQAVLIKHGSSDAYIAETAAVEIAAGRRGAPPCALRCPVIKSLTSGSILTRRRKETTQQKH
jgi:hypothetical protein